MRRGRSLNERVAIVLSEVTRPSTLSCTPKLASYTATYQAALRQVAAPSVTGRYHSRRAVYQSARWSAMAAAAIITATATRPAGRAAIKSAALDAKAMVANRSFHCSRTEAQRADHAAMAAAISRPLGLDTDDQNNTPGVATASNGTREPPRRRKVSAASASNAAHARAAVMRAARTPASLAPTKVPTPAGTNPSGGYRPMSVRDGSTGVSDSSGLSQAATLG